jgi:hypothetical protein
LESQIAELSFFFNFVSVFTIPGPMSQGELQVHQAEPLYLVWLQYLWEVARYPRGCHLRQTNPLPFIPWAQHSHLRIGDYFFKVYSFRSSVFCITGLPHVGYGSSPCTDGLG